MFDKKEFIDDFRSYYHKNKHDEYDLSLHQPKRKMRQHYYNFL